MITLSNLSKTVCKDIRRIGRGDSSGHGTTAGRGTKGQKSRSGGTKGPYFEGGQMPLIRRVPKRGFHSPNRINFEVISLDDLKQRFQEGALVNRQSIYEVGLISKKGSNIKILANGTIDKKLKIESIHMSKAAREKLITAGCVLE
ncbi:MAG TPA: 50S ribosomal protein L15 [Deltaproteobacteria bacterium]|nr:MAG: 50S ribosomal protein L15 [bacterium]HDH10254.1 50S ribosomal protein L15 [Deltaproteobacteria bacterium]